MKTYAQHYADSVAESIAAGEYGDASDIIGNALDIEYRGFLGDPAIVMTIGGPTAWIDPVGARFYAHVQGEGEAWSIIKNFELMDELVAICGEILDLRQAA